MATIQELLVLGKEKLEKSNNEYAKYERKVLLEEVLQQSYMYMLMNGEEEVPREKEQQYMELLEKRCQHYPLQYLLGYTHFMDYVFFVNEQVLIPRNDTEVLVEQANCFLEDRLKERGSVSVLDLCCGSGCIGISLKLYFPQIQLALSDLSEGALEVTRKNLEKHGVEAKVYCGDLFSAVEGKMDLIVSNPPYIEQSVIPTLMPEVKDCEPMMALDGGEDGLDFYRRIIEEAPEYLKDKGILMFEIGHNQGKAVENLMKEKGFLDIAIQKDYAGLDRIVYGHL